MDMDVYQSNAAETAKYRDRCKSYEARITYCMMGLGEAGEVQGKWKKYLRGDKVLGEAVDEIAAELGDVLWYVAMAAGEVGFTLSEIAKMNLQKLASRDERGTLQGDGDSR
jgi:NTP pyrophosphatase (non-canonical NTP hydrolase)